MSVSAQGKKKNKFKFRVLDGVHVEEGPPIITSDDCMTCDGMGKRKNGLPCRLCVVPLKNMSTEDLIAWADKLEIRNVDKSKREDLIDKLKGKRIERTEIRFRARHPMDPDNYVGDIVETDTDLNCHNPPGCPPKFLDLSKDRSYSENEMLRLELERYKERFGEISAAQAASTPPAVPPDTDLDRLTVKQLVELAEEREIDVPPNPKKEDLIKLLKRQPALV